MQSISNSFCLYDNRWVRVFASKGRATQFARSKVRRSDSAKQSAPCGKILIL